MGNTLSGGVGRTGGEAALIAGSPDSSSAPESPPLSFA